LIIFFKLKVEYCYPSIDYTTNDENNIDLNNSNINSDLNIENKVVDNLTNNILLPLIWKTLPSLALPDGSHNHERDTIYFHLPDINDHNLTIFGVSCYRQINADVINYFLF
jgi:hypothetical protein